MKRLNILLIGLFLIGFSACDLLDDQQPQQSLATDAVLTNEEGINNIVIGVYDSFQDSDLAGTNFHLVPDIMAGDAVWVGSFTGYQDIRNFDMTSNNGEVTQLWTNGYRTINNANIVLASLDGITDASFTQAEKDEIRGQMLAIRGITYFEMTRRFGRPWNAPGSGLTTNPASDLGVALRTAPVLDSSDFELLDRSTVQACYNQAIADLTAAAGLVTTAVSASNAGVINQAAVQGYLLKIAMQQGDYAEALTLSNAIIGAGYSLQPNVGDIYTVATSSEVIHRIVQIAQDNNGVNGSLTTFYAPASLGGRGDVNLSQDYIDAFNSLITARMQADLTAAGFTATDDRAALHTALTTSGASLKYPDGTTNSDDTYLTRLSGVFLSRAEALVRVNNTIDTEAINLLNAVRARSMTVLDGAGVPQAGTEVLYVAGDFTTPQDLIDAIILERRIELAFEGDRGNTLTRIGGLFPGGVSPAANNVVYPIPQVEVDANPNITQNPGY